MYLALYPVLTILDYRIMCPPISGVVGDIDLGRDTG